MERFCGEICYLHTIDKKEECEEKNVKKWGKKNKKIRKHHIEKIQEKK